MATKWLCVPFLQKNATTQGGGGGGGVNYVHLQKKCRREDFQNIVLGSYLLTDLLLVKKWKMVNVKLGETNMKIN